MCKNFCSVVFGQLADCEAAAAAAAAAAYLTIFVGVLQLYKGARPVRVFLLNICVTEYFCRSS